ncbi:hypothetical protein RMT89_41630, partial [Streptomyces sp. P17]
PDVFSKLIIWLPDYLSVKAPSGTTVYVNRGGYLYDRNAKTDEFTQPVTVCLIRLKGFEEMPTQFRTYILDKAARRFNIRFFGAAEIEASLQLEEQDAWARVQEFELEYGAFNMLDGDAWVA